MPCKTRFYVKMFVLSFSSVKGPVFKLVSCSVKEPDFKLVSSVKGTVFKLVSCSVKRPVVNSHTHKKH